MEKSEKSGFGLLEKVVNGYKAVEKRVQGQSRVKSTEGKIRNEEDARSEKEIMRISNSISNRVDPRIKRNIIAIKQIGGGIQRFILRIIVKRILLKRKEKMM